MTGFVTIDGKVEPLAIHPGPRLPDGRAIALADGVLTIGTERHSLTFVRDSDRLWVRLAGRTHQLEWHAAVDHLAASAPGAAASGEARATMPGVVVSLAVAAGDRVAAGDLLLVIESMKLETSIVAGLSGTVTALNVAAGDSFERDTLLGVVTGD